jgi:AraC family transcriptional regulator of adaptative response / DNA-3-methyladenine glycosylase II
VRRDGTYPDEARTIRIPFSAPFDWASLVSFLAVRAVPRVERVDGSHYRRIVTVGAGAVVVDVSPDDDRHLELALHMSDTSVVPGVLPLVRRVLDLDAPVEEIAHHLRRDPQLAPLVERRPGLRVPGTWDAFECGARAILGQQVTVRAATTLCGRLVDACGTRVGGFDDLGLTHRFPSAGEVLAADLGTLGMPAARRATLLAFAERVATGSLDVSDGRPLEELTRDLMEVPGIGSWTAGYIAMRLGDRDALPLGDIVLHRTAGALVARAEAWRPFRAYATMHLWTAGTDAMSATAPPEVDSE